MLGMGGHDKLLTNYSPASQTAPRNVLVFIRLVYKYPVRFYVENTAPTNSETQHILVYGGACELFGDQ